MEPLKTKEEICSAVALDLKARKLTHRDVADMIGKTKEVVSTQISGKRRFSKEMATLFSMALGYNRNFLLYGEGELKDDTVVRDLADVSYSVSESGRIDVSVLAGMISVAENLFLVMGDQDAITAWKALQEGDYNKYKTALDGLYERFGRQNFFSPVMAQYICERTASSAGKAFIPIRPTEV